VVKISQSVVLGESRVSSVQLYGMRGREMISELLGSNLQLCYSLLYGKLDRSSQPGGGINASGNRCCD